MELRRRRCVAAACVVVSLLALSVSAAGNTAKEDAELSRQVHVLFDAVAGAPTVAEILEAAPDKNGALFLDLGMPVSQKRFIRDQRLLTPLAGEDTNPRSPLALLGRYMSLTFASEAAANAAVKRLKSHPWVLNAEVNRPMALSVIPQDNYFPQTAFSAQYQWGMYQLNMPAAWDKNRGSAYVAVLDQGIWCNNGWTWTTTYHPDPCVTVEDLRWNFRHYLSYDSWGGDGIHERIVSFTDPVTGLLRQYAGHGTHVAGIIAAQPWTRLNGTSNSGVVGTCWFCSLAIIKMDPGNATARTEAMLRARQIGVQVMNMSWGDSPFENLPSCDSNYFGTDCIAFRAASDADIVLVGAAGNRHRPRIQFPASEPNFIAVGGIEVGGFFWRNGYQTFCDSPNPSTGLLETECGSNWGYQSGGGSANMVVAPALNVISTFYPGIAWNPTIHCGDRMAPNDNQVDAGYGDCTGTSMAAPHVTGIIGIMRSANPILHAADIKNLLLSSTVPCTAGDPEGSHCGAGIPNAALAVQRVLGRAAINRLTPLFSLYSSSALDHVYTIYPQVALSASTTASLIPRPVNETNFVYSTVGSTIPTYTTFLPACSSPPCPPSPVPKAQVSVLTTHVNPLNPSLELWPLYRMSKACSTTNCTRVQHVYASEDSDVNSFEGLGYHKDGIEGYVYPYSFPQPPGTVPLCRKYNSDQDTILFAGTVINNVVTCGTDDGTPPPGNHAYTGSHFGRQSLGWVYSLRAPQAMCVTGLPCGVLEAVQSGADVETAH